ncbi:hypothetical protein FRB90_010533, partial [Tulasnella sp. 427]
IVEGLRHVLEGLGKERLNGVEETDILIPSLTPLIHTLCPNIQFLRVWPLAEGSEILPLLSSGRHDSQTGWLLAHLREMVLSAETPRLVLKIREMIAARADAHLKGMIPEKVRRLRLTLRTRFLYNHVDNAVEAKADVEESIEKIREMVPDAEARRTTQSLLGVDIQDEKSRERTFGQVGPTTLTFPVDLNLNLNPKLPEK